ncbi:PstA family ABC transporter permease [Subtercola sp. RTI3]|uniref:PstA family ABC transporter permease n=1 Tax=Subtercola sp. RTI3 TaxID=3048639 RepID=UPI002B22FA9C|nr:PstA family ABC transporter permease [Subtercola sp. RTI3]MEA9986804.1 PstA family ABC transporter permease [Subtercola sp. RTI3]
MTLTERPPITDQPTEPEPVNTELPHTPPPSTPPARTPGGTRLPRVDLPVDAPDPGRVVVGLSRDDILSVVGAAVAGLSVGVLFTLVFGFIPVGWLLVVSFLWFLGIYATLVFLRNPGPAVIDRLWTVLLWGAGVVVVGSLALVVGFTLFNGNEVFGRIIDPSSGQDFWSRFHFFTQDMGLVGPLGDLDSGGIIYAIVGTLEQIGIALLITVPLGLTCAVFLNEVGGRFAKFVRTIVEAMTALPSVVAGLFIYAAVIVLITKQPSGFAASLAITVLMLPIMIRSSDVVLRLVPGNLREAGLALGAGQWSVVWRVVLPTVRSGLTTAIILATAHGIGETAPVLLTSGVTQNLNFDPFNAPQTSLPLAALKFIENSSHNLVVRGFATAATLLALVLILFIIARAIGGRAAGDITDRQYRQLERKSRNTRRRIKTARRAVETPPPPELTLEDLIALGALR